MENKTLQEIALKHLGEEVQEADRISGRGFVNEIYVLTTNSSKYVLRIDPNETTLDRFQKEAWCMDAAEKAGIPVSRTLGLGIQEMHPYMLLSYVEGEEVEAENRKPIWSKLGEYAQKIHAIEVSGFGERMQSSGSFNGSWPDYLEYNISSLNNEDKLLALGIISESQSERLKNTFLQLKNTTFNFGLIHDDLSLKNTILGSDENVYLLDWGSARVDVIPHMDFAEVLHSSLDEDSQEFSLFLENYGMNKEKFEKIKADIHRLELLRFTDKVRWAIDRKPELIDQKAKELKELFRNK